MIGISAIFQSKQRDRVCSGTVSRGIIENADRCFIRRGFNKGFFLLRLQIVSFCATSLAPYRMYDKHTHAVWHDLTIPEHYNRPVSFSSRRTWSVFHTNQSTDQSEEQQFHARNILHLDATHVHWKMLFTSAVQCRLISRFRLVAELYKYMGFVSIVNDLSSFVNADIRYGPPLQVLPNRKSKKYMDTENRETEKTTTYTHIDILQVQEV